tara:strand:- start:73666 stop:75387 length:1722 start_codon:yes stop_codon:yes gene_type:complete
MIEEIRSNNISSNSFNENDEIEIGSIYRLLKRRIKLISSLTATSFFLGVFYSLLVKPVWFGQFEIVLNEDKSSSRSRAIQSFMGDQNFGGALDLLNINSDSNSKGIKTEVEILKSPSILMPVFEFVNSEKSKDGKDKSNWSYNDWVESHLQINLIKNTTVLNLSYKDTDRYLIIPVLTKISEEYQKYSNRDREKGILEGVSYLDEQISIYKDKAKNKFIEAQRFAIDNDLFIPANNSSMEDLAAKIELTRIDAINKERDAIELRKKIINTNNPERIKNLSNLIFTFVNKRPSTEIESIDALEGRISSDSAKYTAKDRFLIDLKKERDRRINELKNYSLFLLDAQIERLQAVNIAASRPKETLLNFRKLLRDFTREESTLNTLETQRRILALEKAKEIGQPWELITNPTLFDQRISPKRKRIVFVFMISGFILSFIYSSLKEKISGIFYEKKDIVRTFNYPLILHIKQGNKENWLESITLLINGPLAFLKDKNETISLIPVGNLDKDKMNNFAAKLNSDFDKRVAITNNLTEVDNSSSQILLASLGVTKIKDLESLNEKLNIQNIPILGWILLD